MARPDGAIAPDADAASATAASGRSERRDAPMLHELPQAVAALRSIARGGRGGTVGQAALPPGSGAMRDLSGLALARLMHNYGLPALRSGFAATPDEAILVADGIGYPVSLSAVLSAQDGTAVTPPPTVDLRDANALRSAAERMSREAANSASAPVLEGFRVQESPTGDAFVVAVAADPEFGPFIALGAGAAAREAAQRLVVHLLPIDVDDAREMLRNPALSSWPQAAESDALAEAITALSRFFLEHRRWLDSVEIAPLIVLRAGTQVRVGNLRIARAQPFSNR